MKVQQGLIEKTFDYNKKFYITYTKSIIDKSIVLLMLIPAIPLSLLLWLMIKVDSPGPGIYCQQRVGLNGESFYIYKFRTMTNGIFESEKPCDSNDPRITRAGKFLRKTSLDELPQIINVLKGEMSLVGPRPEMKWLVDQYYRDYERQRFLVKPGITGLWQLSMDRSKAIHENLSYDFEYIQNVSFWLDMKILLKTPFVFFNNNNTC